MKGEFWLSSFFFAPVVTCHGIAHDHLFIVSRIEVEGNVFLHVLIIAKIDVKPRANFEIFIAVIGTGTNGCLVQSIRNCCSLNLKWCPSFSVFTLPNTET